MVDKRGTWKDAVSCTMELKSIFAVAVVLILFISPGFSQELSPKGRNVCKTTGSPESAAAVCCGGWAQLGEECIIPLCEGNFTCKENEVCVRPNECRCRHGYFGASCDTKCPTQFWGPDCKGKCNCYPNGKCDDVTGACTCNPNRWGFNCEKPCACQKGKCDQETGKCTCHAGFWGPQCANQCYCAINSVCDQATGRCLCQPGWFGRSCNTQCACNGSPCEQFTGRCQCRERLWGQHCERYCQCVHGKCNQADGSCTCKPGFRGKFCREPCPAGFYGQNCRNRCGHCKGQQPCKVTEGRCITCERGWNGTKCDQMCVPGFFGENCQDVCPPCKDGHHCSRIDGKCPHCNPGWIGDRCEVRCSNGTYGDRCENDCSHCFNGDCHFATGECLCNPGFHGTYCNLTCGFGQYGVNCAQTCPCHDMNCDRMSGDCILLPNQRMGVIAVAVLLVLLLGLLCCCCLCHNKGDSSEQDNSTSGKKAKRLLCGRFSRISTKLPRIPLRRHKLPKVVVAHHDPDTFNCSFIEPPSEVEPQSTTWSDQGSFSSFETSEDGPVYCIPHEDTVDESNEKSSSTAVAESTAEEDAGEYTSLKETVPAADQPLLKSTDSEGGSTSGSESTTGALYAQIARLSKQSKEDEDGCIIEIKGNGKPPSPERTKPRPPDPSTKPKVSWIHGATTTTPTNTPEKGGKGESGTPSEKPKNKEKEKSGKDKTKDKKSPDGKATSGGETAGGDSPSKAKAQKGRTVEEHREHINGVVQNALKKISSFHSDKKAAKDKDKDKDKDKEPEPLKDEAAPKSPKIMHMPQHMHMNSEAATLLAAQLKEKTQSINRNEGLVGVVKTNGLSTPQMREQREKPTPPQKAKRSVGSVGSGGTPQGQGSSTTKPLLPTTGSLQKMVAPAVVSDSAVESTEPRSPEKQQLTAAAMNGSKTAEVSGGGGGGGVGVGVGVGGGDSTPKKTPIKKPPRKKGKEGNAPDTPETKATPKTAIMPPQVVKNN
ncbi:scavenger receptor class F member 2 isoform X2 [Engraulis encrasicolus]|uniref:scavenger receptor class F member 2 isoform X2 n=1 Tax=Engraulis encrasicolus TaxID=184585 RepID=UPI002FCEC2F7